MTIIVMLMTIPSTIVVVSALKLQNNGTECRLLTYIPFSDLRVGPPDPHANPGQYGFGNWPDEASLAEASISLLAAAEMARQHFVSQSTLLTS